MVVVVVVLTSEEGEQLNLCPVTTTFCGVTNARNELSMETHPRIDALFIIA